jgi:hypothetical protein
MAKGMGKGVKNGSLAKPAKGGKGGFVSSPAQMISKKGCK